MRRISAENLLELASTTLRAEVQPALPPSIRYSLAMTLRALDVARREIQIEPGAASWALLDKVYDDGEGTLKMLSADIRSGIINDETTPELRDLLERLLIAELEVRNPGVLKARASID